ncbi:MAG: alpha/beta hydrolase [Burkholderiales bacterium]
MGSNNGRGSNVVKAMGHALLWFLAVVAASTLVGCAGSRPTTIPMKILFDAAPATDGPKSLLVIMPGIQDVPGDLVRHGFVRAVRERGIAADVVIADAHFGYFLDRSFEERIRSDVIAPARARGYASIWLSGVSLGGFGSLLYASRNPLDVDGLITVAPLIARGGVVSEILSAGGLTSWNPPQTFEIPDFGRQVPGWLKGYGTASTPRPLLYLGFGANDHFAPINAALGDLLPEGQRFVALGGRTWAQWITLWEQMLDRVPLPRIGERAVSVAHLTRAR